ncbi:DnaA regulatory inactivator Hda [Nitrogeniibacter mangrovi]|uniref:DnaA regulatory inactivator Hda n=1 Tax=Nitrogeniibacter mangrovi TaxID=2016596 RepID=A0A6C1B450_9RHOO|nr:DnaA regulatory inactivator Hda [Nitrogeniibacter mangrovi]QID18451.1 DnaA regulatory inactivator Hda [Nitrogeniibacter mangrovi]
MKQLVLDIRLDAPPRLGNYFIGDNRPLLAALDALVRGEPTGHLYLWGQPATGKSHLLRAVAAEAADTGYLGAAEVAEPLPAHRILAIDDIEHLDDAAAIAVFNAFNRAAAQGQTLLLAGDAPPRELKLREDLRTRIGQCLAFEIQPLTDAARSAILSTLATQRGLRLDGDVIGYLMRHGRRDMPSMLHTLDALDRASLEHKRAITLPLLRDLMRTGLDI